MDDEKLNKSLKVAVTRAIEEACKRGSATVEAEHLLLALASDETLTAAQVLAGAGLGYGEIGAALDRARTEALHIAGVGPVNEDALAATSRRARPGWGKSAKDAILRRRSVSTDGRKRSAETELLIGILLANLGTVPRMLAIVGTDRSDLIRRAMQA
jgi:ATP-dependent Clp protease ATP-binding subunit ClpA